MLEGLYFVIAVVAIVGFVWFIFLTGFHSFGRWTTSKPGLWAGIFTAIAFVAIFWGMAWGDFAWPAFFILAIIVFLVGKALLKPRDQPPNSD